MYAADLHGLRRPAGRQPRRPWLHAGAPSRDLEDVAAEVVDTVHLARRLDGDGTQAWTTVEARSYEGMVAKDPRSTYRAGPTRAWVKVKLRREGTFLIGGIATNGDRFAGVLVGERAGRALRYLGTVEMGYNRSAVDL